jgi:hypothetical protein
VFVVEGATELTTPLDTVDSSTAGKLGRAGFTASAFTTSESCAVTFAAVDGSCNASAGAASFVALRGKPGNTELSKPAGKELFAPTGVCDPSAALAVCVA